ncbi:hypothetical protein [Algoriphagus sp.]|uniref:hypothetical protein n=1 Tax=Algoriphagus sp. TaxID=1872435 RepID=UPI003F6F7E69
MSSYNQIFKVAPSGELDLIYSDKVDLDPSGIPYQYPNGAIAQISYFDQELAIYYAQQKYLEKFSLTDAALLKKINIPSLEEDFFLNVYNLGLSNNELENIVNLSRQTGEFQIQSLNMETGESKLMATGEFRHTSKSIATHISEDNFFINDPSEAYLTFYDKNGNRVSDFDFYSEKLTFTEGQGAVEETFKSALEGGNIRIIGGTGTPDHFTLIVGISKRDPLTNSLKYNYFLFEKSENSSSIYPMDKLTETIITKGNLVLVARKADKKLSIEIATWPEIIAGIIP